MGHNRRENRNWDFDENMGRSCHGHRGTGSLMGLVFGLVSFSITLAFRIVGVVFQALFAAFSGVISGAGNNGSARKTPEVVVEKENVSYTINDIKQEPTDEKKSGVKKDKAASNVREFKKHESSKTQAEVAEAENKAHKTNEHNKDIYVVLFILTIIPAIVALAMGKLLFAGVIGTAGFGLMLVTGIIAGIAGNIRKKSAEQKTKVAEEAPEEEEDSVEKLIKDAFEKLFEIRKDIDKVKDAEIRAKMEAICCTGEKIIGEVRTNPEGLAQVRKFFYYYLGAFAEIVKKYLRLSNFEESSEEVSKLVAETESAFADIDGIFKNLCEKLLEKDMMHLKAEINVIKNSN